MTFVRPKPSREMTRFLVARNNYVDMENRRRRVARVAGVAEQSRPLMKSVTG